VAKGALAPRPPSFVVCDWWARCALPTLRSQPNTMRDIPIFRNGFNPICPVQPRLVKHFASHPGQIISSSLASRPGRRALAIVTNVGVGCGGRGSVVAQGSAGRVPGFREHPVGAKTSDVVADGKAVWSWHPLLVSTWRRFFEPNRVSINRSFVSDGDKTNSSPGRARRKPLKPLRRECRVFGEPVVTTVCYLHYAHGLRVQRAPGISLRLLQIRRKHLHTIRAYRAAKPRSCA
jgi:hypothetical protein